MKKIKIYSVVSLDGFLAKPDGDIEWIMDWVTEQTVPENHDYGFHEFSRTLDSVILNQSYYNLLRVYDVCWPPVGLKCYLITDPLSPLPEIRDIHLLPNYADDPSATAIIAELLDKGDGDIWIAGDHELISLFAGNDLIDEVVINILPVVLGEGVRLSFGNKESRWITDDSVKYASGVVQIKYHADRS